MFLHYQVVGTSPLRYYYIYLLKVLPHDQEHIDKSGQILPRENVQSDTRVISILHYLLELRNSHLGESSTQQNDSQYKIKDDHVKSLLLTQYIFEQHNNHIQLYLSIDSNAMSRIIPQYNDQ